MKENVDWKAYLGKRVLISYSWECYKEVRVNEVSPSGKYVRIDDNWVREWKYDFIEVLL